MTLKRVRECDVFKTVKGVQDYQVQVSKASDKPGRTIDVLRECADLSPRGLVRLQKFIRRALKPPGNTDSDADDKRTNP